jgi:hypothetical protein
MRQRSIIKMLRRAEEALRDERALEGESIYRTLLEAFEEEQPSILEHAAAIYGLIRSLHAQGETERAITVAENACSILASRRSVGAAA